MIQRINFIEKEPFQTTYGTLLLFLGLALGLCLVVFLTTWIGGLRSEAHIKSLFADIADLKQRRESLLQQEEIVQGNAAFAAIHNILKKEPRWFHLLNQMSHALPSNVWLVSFKSFGKEESPSKKGILLNGIAKKPQAVAHFLTALHKLSSFEKVVLTSSKEEHGVFHFSVTCDMSNPR